MNKVLVGGVALAVVLSGLAFFSAPSNTVTERVVERVGASVGPEHTEAQYFRGGVTVGGLNNVATSSTASAYTLTATYVNPKVSYVAWNAGLNIAVTLPNATSSSFGAMRVGESFEQIWYSATTTAATTITFTAPAVGIDLQEPELDGTVILNGLEFAKVTYIKTGASTVSVITDITQVGD